MATKILLVSPPVGRGQTISAPLTEQGYQVVDCRGGDRLEAIRRYSPNLVIVGPSVPEQHAGFADSVRQTGFKMPILFLAPLPGQAPLDTNQPVDFLPPPYDAATIIAGVQRSLARTASNWPAGVEPLIGVSAFIRHLRDLLPKAAASDCNVLITGETGTGKELIAESVHRLSPRRAAPWVPLNCAAMPETLLESELFGFERGAFTGAAQARAGKFELAGNGTIFLDEIGELSLGAQAKLLRVLESRETTRIGGARSRPFPARVVAATNQEVDRLVKEGRFRADLFYRLNVLRIHVPPLRERPEDVSLLLHHLAAGVSRRSGLAAPPVVFDASAVAALSRYDWPGNVREMRNLVESLAVLGPEGPVTEAALPEPFRLRSGGGAQVLNTRAALQMALDTTGWNKSEAARRLNWSRMTVYRKIAQFRLGQ